MRNLRGNYTCINIRVCVKEKKSLFQSFNQNYFIGSNIMQDSVLSIFRCVPNVLDF